MEFIKKVWRWVSDHVRIILLSVVGIIVLFLTGKVLLGIVLRNWELVSNILLTSFSVLVGLLVVGFTARFFWKKYQVNGRTRVLETKPNEQKHKKVERELTDKDVARGKHVRRLVVFVIVSSITVVLPYILTNIIAHYAGMSSWIVSWFGLQWKWGVFIALASTGWMIVGKLLPSLTIYVPLAQGAVTLNSFSGKPITYGGGLHPRLPWEQIEERSHQTLEIVTVSIEEGFDSLDGQMTVKLDLMFQADLERLAQFYYNDDSTIEETFLGRLSQIVSGWISTQMPDDARTKMKELGECIENEMGIPHAFGEQKTDQENEDDESALEARFGSRFVGVNVRDIEYPETIRKAKEAEAATNPILAMYDKIKGHNLGALDRAAVMAGVKNINITRYDGLQGGDGEKANVSLLVDGRGEQTKTALETEQKEQKKGGKR